MKFSKATLAELGNIMKEEFKVELNKKDLEKLAYTLVGYFSLMQKIESRHKFGNSPDRAIDTKRKSGLDREVK